ncbi:unnamed protein product, partial [Ascophyllum nodosum]
VFFLNPKSAGLAAIWLRRWGTRSRRQLKMTALTLGRRQGRATWMRCCSISTTTET